MKANVLITAKKVLVKPGFVLRQAKKYNVKM